MGSMHIFFSWGGINAAEEFMICYLEKSHNDTNIIHC